MDPKYGERYRDLFERHWWWRARSKFVLDVVRRLPQENWQTILDIGCGDGLFLPELARFGEVEGVEPFAELVSRDNPYRSRIRISSFDENYLPGKQYSLILMLDVLEHSQNAVGTLRHALNLLGPRGKIVLTLPAFMTLWTNHDVLNRHYVRYTKSSFRTVAREAGLHIEEERYLYHWTCPLKIGIRLVERVLRLSPKPAEVPALAINELLFRISRIEQIALTPLSLPFGSSLMIIGSKDMEKL
jgi:2-polyprenyl-3-methyl-5-hydroxy-6-metoxy-1,4-benzoquinol methylase